jgi:hypothetical protein
MSKEDAAYWVAKLNSIQAHCCPGMAYRGEHDWWCQNPHASRDILNEPPECEHILKTEDGGTCIKIYHCGITPVLFYETDEDFWMYLCEEHKKGKQIPHPKGRV